jgi:hypothetical protein
MLKLTGTTKKITNSELVALTFAVQDFTKKFNSDYNRELYRNLITLENSLFDLVKGNTHTHYEINIEGVEDNIVTQADKEIDKLFNSKTI